jgi:short-subunit dehydrogenase
MKLAGSHSVITGGSHGIGVDLAREFARRGATVTVVGRNAERLKAVAAEIDGNFISLDLADERAVATAVAAIEETHGAVDILVNNAGLALVSAAASCAPDDARNLMSVNAIAPMELVRQVLPGMIARGRGHIVNVSSLAGVSAVPDMAIYGASKAALHHYTAVVQRELAHSHAPVCMTLATLGEVAGTQMMEEARQSPVIAAVSRRLARTRAMPDLSTALVAVKVADAVERDAAYVTIPARISVMIGLRNLPSRIQDLALIGLKPPREEP